MKFSLTANYSPAGDQPQAIKALIGGIEANKKHQVLLGVTGSGKTYTMANVIAQTQKPTLVISHNKTLALQLYQEFRDFFPQNGVGYFVSYYDYYQPEAYVPQTDTYIAKETDINEEIDKLRLQATSLLFSRKDVIIVASVSCIYNLGSPLEYNRFVVEVKKGQEFNQRKFMEQLLALHYLRTRFQLQRSTFRVRGDVVEIMMAYSDEIIKLKINEGLVEKITTRPLIAGEEVELEGCLIYPAKHFLTNPEVYQEAFKKIKAELLKRLIDLKKENKLVEAQRLQQRVNFDLEMIAEMGYVNGIENYSRYFDGRKPGDAPWSLLDYFNHAYNGDYLTIIDESHITVPQMRGMYAGDLSRKKVLIDFGFRLPSALDNRPLRFAEILPRLPQTVYVSATPDEWEVGMAEGEVVEQLIRPTGLIDPEIFVRPSEGQIQDLLKEILIRKKKGERVLITTLTKRMAEELSWWMADIKNTREPVKIQYLHADIKTLERSDILTSLRSGDYDVVVGVNLLREGLDLPEVSLVAILDADKQGFLRSKTSLIQTMGRAARNVGGKVILYADYESIAIKEAIKEVTRRRKRQLKYNQEHGITPVTISKPIRERIVALKIEEEGPKKYSEIDFAALTPGEIRELIPQLRKEMRQAAADLDFETAAQLRDLITKIA